MGDINFRQIQSAARIVLICPDCGQENSEFVDVLRETRFYACRGEGCYYSFELGGPRRDTDRSFAETCRKFYAAFYALHGERLGLKSLLSWSDRLYRRGRIGANSGARSLKRAP